MNKIFVWCESTGMGSGNVHGSTRGGDVMGYALAEDGEGLASHYSSSESFAAHDMGVTSDWKHDGYKEKYPDGYELVWLGLDPKDNAELDAAMELNKKRAADEEALALASSPVAKKEGE